MPKLAQFDLTGQTAIVTGGGSGLGREMADALAELGANIVLCARKAERCEQAAAEIESAYGVGAIGMRCDVRDRAEIDAVVERAVADFGRVDVLVNNSGTTWAADPEDISVEGWQKVIDVNLSGLFFFSQAAGRLMIAQGHGKIINVASVMGFQGVLTEAMNAIPYNASKGGVVALTRDLAVKWARHGVLVNALAPGWFPSEMSGHTLEHAGPLLIDRIPLRRFGKPEEIKGAVQFLASAASDFVTGTTLHVDGGQTAW
jgi:NAD(P)-dependent dehydrogenase (short-subunit alcohol dehydrogenase family)